MRLHTGGRLKRLSDEEIVDFISEAKEFGIKAHKVVNSAEGVYIDNAEHGLDSLVDLLLARPQYACAEGILWATECKRLRNGA